MKHIPTGFYYKPSNSNGNLSKKGKAYVNMKPNINWTYRIRIKFFFKTTPNKFQEELINYFKLDLENKYYINVCVNTLPSDWEIVEITE